MALVVVLEVVVALQLRLLLVSRLNRGGRAGGQDLG